jgi:hypothetical protein
LTHYQAPIQGNFIPVHVSGIPSFSWNVLWMMKEAAVETEAGIIFPEILFNE